MYLLHVRNPIGIPIRDFHSTSYTDAATTMSEKTPPPNVMRRLTERDVKRLRLRQYRGRNAAVGLGLLAGVLGVYAYSMLAVKQENFLDEEFDQPTGNKKTSNRWPHCAL